VSHFESPINAALASAEFDRLCSMVYSVLNGVKSERPMSEWRDLGTYQIACLIVQSAAQDWERHPETFWMYEWIAQHLRNYDPGGLCLIVDRWLQNVPLDERVSPDPREEDLKMTKLKQLSSALNPGG
jgi:hypothetical protein